MSNTDSDLDLLNRFMQLSETPGGSVVMHVMPDKLLSLINAQIQAFDERIKKLLSDCLESVDLFANVRREQFYEITYEPKRCGDSVLFECSSPKIADLIRRYIRSRCFQVEITEQEEPVNPSHVKLYRCLHSPNRTTVLELIWWPHHPSTSQINVDTTQPHLILDSSFPWLNSIYVYCGCADDCLMRTIFKVRLRISRCNTCPVNPQNTTATLAVEEAPKEVARLQTLKRKLEDAKVRLIEIAVSSES